MNSEFETEQADPRRRLQELIETAKNRLRYGRLSRHIFLDGKSLDTADLARDQAKFIEQERRLNGRRGLVVELEDEQAVSGSHRVMIPVDLDLQGSTQIDRRISIAVEGLTYVGFDARAASPEEAGEAFIDRAAETLAMRALALDGFGYAPPSDIVSSTNSGDDILCAKGWFLSTGHIVGQSTCALSAKPGRYSLGVCHSGQTRYHSQLFNLPIGHIHLDLP